MILFCASSSPPSPWSPALSLCLSCKTQADINQIHAKLITTGLINNSYFTKRIILKFANSQQKVLVQFANILFFSHYLDTKSVKKADPFVWNSMIKVFSHGSYPVKALEVFVLMHESGVLVDEYSFSLVLKACSKLGLVWIGIQIHGLLRKFDFGMDLYLQNCLISMYVKCGFLEFARQVFDKIVLKDSVSYNSMIDGYVKYGMVDFASELFDSLPLGMRNMTTWNTMINGYLKSSNGFQFAWELFEKMPERDTVSWNLMIDFCAKSGKMGLGRTLFDMMPGRDITSWGIMVDGYAKAGKINVARSLFDEMPVRDVISCNSLMAGYVKNGLCTEALNVFDNMLTVNNLVPDNGTLLISLSATAQLGDISKGIAIHSYIRDNKFVESQKLGVALIDMYAKCGSIESAMTVFEDIQEKNVVHWNAMINGLAIHGLGELAFDFFMEMKRLHVKPDDITFIALLNACGHAGMLKEGMMCFEILRRVYKINPKLEHYGCIVDILSRAGRIEEAKTFVKAMPIAPNSVIFRTLLSACKKYENLSIGVPVAKHLIGSNSSNSSSYVLLSNMYAQLGMWEYVKNMRKMMKEKDLKKFHGCSWIELEGSVHEFFAADTSHPQVKEIFSTLYT